MRCKTALVASGVIIAIAAIVWSILDRRKPLLRGAPKETGALMLPGVKGSDPPRAIDRPDSEKWQLWFKRFAESDPEGLLRWVESSSDPTQRTQALKILLAEWTYKSPLAAGRAVGTIKEPALMAEYAELLSQCWPMDRIGDAESWLSIVPKGVALEAIEDLSKRASELPFETALQATADLEGALRDAWIARVVRSWDRERLPDLVQWAASTDEKSRTIILKELLPRLATWNPRQAATYIDNHFANAPFDIRRRVALEWGRSDPNSALEWVESLPTTLQRDVAVRTILTSVAASDPWAAANAALQIDDAKTRLEASLDVVRQWSKSDPWEAASWLQRSVSENGYYDGIAVVAEEYTKKDWSAAGAWLASLPQGPHLDRILGEYVQSIQTIAPDAAAEWANSIQASEERKRRLSDVLKIWRRKDPGHANAWAAQNGL